MSMRPSAYLVSASGHLDRAETDIREALKLARLHRGTIRALVLWTDVAHRLRTGAAEARRIERADADARLAAIVAVYEDGIAALRVQLGIVPVADRPAP